MSKTNEKKKDNSKDSLPDLIGKLKNVPFGCHPHEDIWNKVSKKVASKYPNQYVLCTANELGSFEVEKESQLPSITKRDKVINYFSKKDTFMHDALFQFKPREEVEYNFDWKQINVFGFITDGTGYALLEKVTNGNITMVGGHVDYHAKAYNVSQFEWLAESLQKELDEEIAHNKTLKVKTQPVAILNTNKEFHDLFHMAVVYKIEVDNIRQWFAQVKSGEPDKHNVVVFDNKSALLSNKKTHHWIRAVNDYL